MHDLGYPKCKQEDHAPVDYDLHRIVFHFWVVRWSATEMNGLSPYDSLAKIRPLSILHTIQSQTSIRLTDDAARRFSRTMLLFTDIWKSLQAVTSNIGSATKPIQTGCADNSLYRWRKTFRETFGSSSNSWITFYSATQLQYRFEVAWKALTQQGGCCLVL